jgi:hypothetical protein
MPVQHRDITDAQLHEVKGAASASAGQLLTATGSGTATFQTPGFTTTAMGFWDYNDTATVSTPIALTVPGTEYQLTNNGLGANTNTTFRLPSLTDIFNTSTNYFSFIGLQLGDTVDVRVDLEVVSSAANTVVETAMELGIGGSAYKLNIDRQYLKSAGTHKIVSTFSFYLGNSNTLDNPARILMKSDTAGATVKVNGWYVRAITNG